MILLIVSHAGFQLRSDDPSALKEIILLVQQRVDDCGKKETFHAMNPKSRIQSMILAISDLKNNRKKTSHDELSEKISFYRKRLGRMKALAYQADNLSSSSLCLRITLSDLQNIQTKGRWWSVGSSWVGNPCKEDVSRVQYMVSSKDSAERSTNQTLDTYQDETNKRLLALATKNRMNSDSRRAIFCILMGSHDYEDAFLKLLTADLLNKDVIRVNLDCCAREHVYNPFYSLLGVRLCEYTSSLKFAFQLAFWDIFNQLNENEPMKFKTKDIRRASNLAKLLAHLVKNGCLKLNVLRRLDIMRSTTSEPIAVFLTVFFIDLFESINDTSRLHLLLSKGISSSGQNRSNNLQVNGEDYMEQIVLNRNFQDSLHAFLLKVLQPSPKNVKSSIFEKNLNVALKVFDLDD